MPGRANEILKFMAAPSKIANALNWKKGNGSILTMDIGRKCIGLAVSSHPSKMMDEEPLVKKLQALDITLITKGRAKRALSPLVLEDLQKIVQEHNICGFVVSWPLQKEGRAGAPCGKVLHTLDSLVQDSSTIVTRTRPFCLWDMDHHHVSPQAPNNVDQWGRLQVYTKRCTTNKAEHKASEEQYTHHKCSSSGAVDVWNDFCREQWPELYPTQSAGGAATTLSSTTTPTIREFADTMDFDCLDSYEFAEHYSKVARL